MPSPVPNPTPNRARMQRQFAAAAARRSKIMVQDLVPTYVSADYAYWREIWRGIRHAMIGEVEIKRQGTTYLSRPESMDDEQWAAYLDRAVFYNMVYRTVTGLNGAIFRRDPRLLKAGPKLTKATDKISKDGLSLNLFAKVVSQEMLSVGRYGVLLDKATTDDPNILPYLAGYTVENILDWTTQEIDGRMELDYILLREFKVDRRIVIEQGTTGFQPNPRYGQFYQLYRILRLLFNEGTQRWEFQQEVYERTHGDANLTEDPVITKPQIYGVPFKRIPFFFFNSTTTLSDIEKPPILDILTINLSHYRTYAQLEHGRFFTANPVYYVTGGSEDDDYHIGPSVVWQVEAGQKAGLIEFNGLGLKSLETALKTKEDQVASLGGRLLGDSANAGQSDNQVKLKDRNEQSLLLNVTTVLNQNFTDLLRLLSLWLNEQPWDQVQFRVNQDFLLANQGAREFRAISMMYQAGQLPIEITYEYFLAAEVIPQYVDLETFKNMLDDPDQFPNDPNFDARKEGFADAKAKQQHEEQELKIAHEANMAKDEQVAELALAEIDAENKVDVAKVSARAAALAPQIPAVPGSATQANSADTSPKPGASGGQPSLTPNPTPTPKPKPAPAKKPVPKNGTGKK